MVSVRKLTESHTLMLLDGTCHAMLVGINSKKKDNPFYVFLLQEEYIIFSLMSHAGLGRKCEHQGPCAPPCQFIYLFIYLCISFYWFSF